MIKVASEIAKDIIESERSKQMKVRTLIKKFGFKKRTEESARKITQELSELEIYLNPPL